ncbi:MAG: hypothetical protein AVDCRST_MAG59-2710 [uncultured Thermomicrobiales bacterium]|uniref:Uncharacterized protein n=1 Tax=uncultured Thermomicrobiales bacterium TaxID=1645740 RepID=A0A6J4UX78_9BACT|nr:MAG: hypothetical protein AVDCRST_MAG59-2710 [uncultured Thermomicrobiales bacterium]
MAGAAPAGCGREAGGLLSPVERTNVARSGPVLEPRRPGSGGPARLPVRCGHPDWSFSAGCIGRRRFAPKMNFRSHTKSA